MWRCMGHTVGPNGNFFHRYAVAPGSEIYCMGPKEVAIPTADGEGELPATRAGEFGAVLLACGVAVPTGAVRVVWEMALDRVPPATLTFSKPKAWLVQRMRVHKGKCYKLAREGTA